MDHVRNTLSLLTALSGAVLAIAAEAATVGKISLLCRYPVDYPSSNETLMIIPREVEVDRTRGTVSWNGVVSGVSADITNKSITFVFNEYTYMISRTSGAIRFFSPQGLERANEYKREMLQGLLRQGKTVEQAQADVDAGLQNQIYAHEHSGTCDLAIGARL